MHSYDEIDLCVSLRCGENAGAHARWSSCTGLVIVPISLTALIASYTGHAVAASAYCHAASTAIYTCMARFSHLDAHRSAPLQQQRKSSVAVSAPTLPGFDLRIPTRVRGAGQRTGVSFAEVKHDVRRFER